MTQAFLVFVLVKVLWTGAIFNDQGLPVSLAPATPHISTSVEASLAACKSAGSQWYTDSINAANHGKIDDLQPNAFTYDCITEAVGGEDA